MSGPVFHDIILNDHSLTFCEVGYSFCFFSFPLCPLDPVLLPVLDLEIPVKGLYVGPEDSYAVWYYTTFEKKVLGG